MTALPNLDAPDLGPSPPVATGLFTPFRNRLFLAFWTASLVSNFGVLIQGVGAAWLMTTLATSALMVTLVTVATVLPLVLFSLPAGAAADIWDRRWVMLAAQIAMLLVSLTLAVVTWLDLVTPTLLLALTFLLGCGMALYGPASQASIGDRVSREDLAGAVSLNSLGFNLSRAVGPAFGGLVVATAGPQAAFFLNSVTYAGLIAVLVRWKRPIDRPAFPPETLSAAMGAGLRYSLLSPEIGTVLLRALLFGVFASALTSLMPLIARDQLGGTSLTYGLLLGIFGMGSVGGALFIGVLRARVPNEMLLRAVSLILGAAGVVVGLSTSLTLTLGALLLAGAAWVLALSMFNVVVQLSSPRWVVGRSIAMTQMVTFGGFAGGSLGWGLVTEGWGLTSALVAGGLGMAASSALGLVAPIATVGAASGALPALPDAREALAIDPRSGPVVTTVQYRVASEDAAAFVRGMWELRRIRRRDGSHAWAILRDLGDPEVWIERFQSRTWLDYLRLAGRRTASDIEVLQLVNAFHRGSEPPRVQHSLERSPGSFATDGSDRIPRGLPAHAVDPHLPAG